MIDDAAGLPSGYTGEVLTPAQFRGIGRISLGPLFGALGLALAVVEDPEALARVARLGKRNRAQVRRRAAA
jgi:hypothetical protein